MISLKNILFLSFLFALSGCVNEVKNTFTPGTLEDMDDDCILKIPGKWEKTGDGDIPERLDFDLKFDDETVLRCNFAKEQGNKIYCPFNNIQFNIKFSQQFMDEAQEYVIKESPFSGTWDCRSSPSPTDPSPSSSSFLYFNLLILFLIILI